MPRTPEELERAAAEAEAWLDSIDPATLEAENTDDLRAIALGVAGVAEAEHKLAERVRAARVNGRSWGRIAMALGVSKQAAAKRFGDPDSPPTTAVGPGPESTKHANPTPATPAKKRKRAAAVTQKRKQVAR